MIAVLKFGHILALVIWCAGLIVMPFLLGLHRHLKQTPGSQSHYTQFRYLTHTAYTFIVTPAAIVAIVFGTGLIFATQVFEPWLLAKLACVSGMVLAHAWLGHLLVLSKERPITWRMPPPAFALFGALPCMAGVLWFVLAKPDLQPLANLMPIWLTEPLAPDLREKFPLIDILHGQDGDLP